MSPQCSGSSHEALRKWNSSASSSPLMITPAKRPSDIADNSDETCADIYKGTPPSKKICTSQNAAGALDVLARKAVHFLSHVSGTIPSAHKSDANRTGPSDSHIIIPPLAFLEYIGVSQPHRDFDRQHQVCGFLPLPALPCISPPNIRPILPAGSPIPSSAFHMKIQSRRTITPCTARAAQYLLDLHR